MAVDRVEKRLRRVTAALDAAGIPYAVIGGNAVAAWVARADPGATRTTKDVDLLVRRADLDRLSEVMQSLGFERHDLQEREAIGFLTGDAGKCGTGVPPVRTRARRPCHSHLLEPLVWFRDPEEPSRRSGVRLVWADELIRPSYSCPAPSVTEAVRDPEGFWLLDLPALVRMKLTSYRDIDRVHVADLLSVGLIDDAVRSRLPAELGERLAKIEELSEE